MTGRRVALLWAGAWLVVVVLATALVWAVISRAGEGVVSATGPSLSSPSGSSSTSSPSSPSADPSADPAPDDPTSSATGGPGGPAVESRTWEGVAGRVEVACAGSTATLGDVVAWAGFRFEIDDRGPDRVEVEFEAGEGGDGSGSGSGSDDADRDTRVRATCPAGVPTFEIDD